MLFKNRLFSRSSLYIASKELNLFFASPIAWLFLGVFIASTLFIVFWAESYFSRNIADIRPMFEWMPIVLIFLSAALTMRMWSEERKNGTLEHVLTLPASSWEFVIGKFSACKILLVLALALTLPLPITISIMGNLDWGPVLSGYLATLFLGTAYIAIGLYISSRSDNQIVSLILTVIVCSVFYFLGSPVLLKLVSNDTAETLRALGSGSRFESITRGVLDIRDFYYYFSICVVFLVLNRYGLEQDRWASDGNRRLHNRWKIGTALIIGNLLALNFVLAPMSGLRLDTTEGKIYSISNATRNYLNQLQEPLLIRGYFSAKTHPLLAPLVPQVQDLLKEYAAVNKHNVRVEIVDPASNPEAEEEAGSKYGIKPVPFRIADRYQSSVVNSYFNLLIRYGNEYKVIGFEDLIEVKAGNNNDLDVQLRNPEYDITNAIKKILYAYQSGGNLFSTIQKKLKLTAYVSSDERLPASLKELNRNLHALLEKTAHDSNHTFSYDFIDPEAGDGSMAKALADTYGFQPMASSLFDTNTFYYYLVLSNDELAVQITLPEESDEAALKRTLDSGLKRFAQGFTKTIGLVTPEANPYAAQMGQPAPPSFNALQQILNENTTAKPTNLSTGKVPDDIDLLVIMAPDQLDEKSIFAIDQFLMQGGTVILATSPFLSRIQPSAITASEQASNVEDWLLHNGLSLEKTFVLDAQNSAFPIPVSREVGLFSVQELSVLDYPYFIELREKELNQENAITKNLPQLSLPWASPIIIDSGKNSGRTIIELATSSVDSWLSSDLDIHPKVREDGSAGFDVGVLSGQQLLATSISGRFESYFKNKESPLLQKDTTQETNHSSAVISSIVRHSPESARIILIGSNSFAEDNLLRLQSSMSDHNYMNPLQFITNAVEWSLEDEGLLSIRSRSHFNRTLPPLEDKQRHFWEALNYALGFLGIALLYLFVYWQKRQRHNRYQRLLLTLNDTQARPSPHTGAAE